MSKINSKIYLILYLIILFITNANGNFDKNTKNTKENVIKANNTQSNSIENTNFSHDKISIKFIMKEKIEKSNIINFKISENIKIETNLNKLDKKEEKPSTTNITKENKIKNIEKFNEKTEIKSVLVNVKPSEIMKIQTTNNETNSSNNKNYFISELIDNGLKIFKGVPEKMMNAESTSIFLQMDRRLFIKKKLNHREEAYPILNGL